MTVRPVKRLLYLSSIAIICIFSANTFTAGPSHASTYNGVSVYNITTLYRMAQHQSTKAQAVHGIYNLGWIRNTNGGGVYSGINTYNSPSWTGYVVEPSSAWPSNYVHGVYGSWLVQNVINTGIFQPVRFSTQWVGIGGFLDSSLIQIGTESDSNARNLGTIPQYYAWFEVFNSPSSPQIILTNTVSDTDLPVSPNDTMVAQISFVRDVNAITQEWYFYIRDVSQGWVYNGVLNYSSNRTTADFIDEDTCSNATCTSLEPFSNFSFAKYGTDFNSAGFNSSLIEIGRQIPL